VKSGLLLKHRDNTQNPPIGHQSVSDTWSLAKVVRKVEFELLHLVTQWRDGRHARPARRGRPALRLLNQGSACPSLVSLGIRIRISP